MKFFLIAAKGKQKGLPIPIKIDLFMIGSDKVCQLRCNQPGIGGRHCALVVRERKVFIRDFDSGETTLLNNAVVPPGEEWPVHAGDRLMVGPLEFVIQFREKALSQRDLEEWALSCLDADHSKQPHEAEEVDARQITQRFYDASQAAATIMSKLQELRGVVKGRLRVSQEGGITTIRFNDVNLVEESEIALVKKEIHDNLGHHHVRILFDFKNVQKMSSTCVEMLEGLYRWIRNNGSRMAMCRLRPELRGILNTLGALKSVPHFGDKKVAMKEPW
jgi:anti-anti-sigma regulatory factor